MNKYIVSGIILAFFSWFFISQSVGSEICFWFEAFSIVSFIGSIMLLIPGFITLK